MIRRLLNSLFAAPDKGAAPSPHSPIPRLAPAPGTSAYHQRRAHRHGTAVHLAYGRWMVGHDCMTPEEIAEQAEQAATEWALFSIALRHEVEMVRQLGGEG